MDCQYLLWFVSVIKQNSRKKPTLTLHVYISTLDKRVFMKRWSGLFQRGAVWTTTVETGKASLHLHCKLIKRRQERRLWDENTLELFFKRPINQHHFSLFGVSQLPRHFQTLYLKCLRCIFSLDSFILTSPLAWLFSAACSEAAAPPEAGGLLLHHLWPACHSLDEVSL